MNTLDAVIQGKYGTGVTNFRRMSQAEQTPSRSLALERKVQEALAAIEQNPTRSPQMQEWIPELKKQFSTLFPDAVAVSEPPAPSRPVQSEQPRPAQPTQPEVQSPQPPQSQATSQPENPLGAETQGQGGISPSRLALYRGEGMTGQAEVDVNIWKQKTAGIGSERVSPDGFDNSGLIKGSEAALKADKLGTLAKLPSESQPGQFDLVPLSWHGYSEPQRLMMEQFFDVEVAQGATPNYRAELIRPSTVTADNALVSKGLIRLVTKT
ncbi:hypothetical protein HY374_03810 [Candidatus Berkelbacteria bacterium]|nr:hypothetical protein [Candidatus Berkelbacteria bacterium]